MSDIFVRFQGTIKCLRIACLNDYKLFNSIYELSSLNHTRFRIWNITAFDPMWCRIICFTESTSRFVTSIAPKPTMGIWTTPTSCIIFCSATRVARVWLGCGCWWLRRHSCHRCCWHREGRSTILDAAGITASLISIGVRASFIMKGTSAFTKRFRSSCVRYRSCLWFGAIWIDTHATDSTVCSTVPATQTSKLIMYTRIATNIPLGIPTRTIIRLWRCGGSCRRCCGCESKFCCHFKNCLATFAAFNTMTNSSSPNKFSTMSCINPTCTFNWYTPIKRIHLQNKIDILVLQGDSFSVWHMNIWLVFKLTIRNQSENDFFLKTLLKKWNAYHRSKWYQKRYKSLQQWAKNHIHHDISMIYSHYHHNILKYQHLLHPLPNWVQQHHNPDRKGSNSLDFQPKSSIVWLCCLHCSHNHYHTWNSRHYNHLDRLAEFDCWLEMTNRPIKITDSSWIRLSVAKSQLDHYFQVIRQNWCRPEPLVTLLRHQMTQKYPD